MGSLTLTRGATVEVQSPRPPVFTVRRPESKVAVLPVHGPQGPPGPTSPNAGQPRFTGEGPPGLIVGAVPGDEYLDHLTGDIYKLV